MSVDRFLKEWSNSVNKYFRKYHNNLSHRKKVKFKKLRIILPVSYSETNES